MNLFDFFALLMGAVVGSFINLCALRIPAGESIVSPGSYADCCKRPLKWFENIPILSFVLLRGRCRICKTPIAWHYPLVEGLCGGMALLCFLMWGIQLRAIATFVLLAALLLMSIIDLKHMILPNVITLPGIPLGILAAWTKVFPLSLSESIAGAVLGGGLLWLLAFLYLRLRRREGLGGGDIKLMAMLGAFTGVKGVIFILFASSLLGGLVGFGLILASKKGRYSPIPYGPFLGLAAAVYLLFGESIWAWYLERLF